MNEVYVTGCGLWTPGYPHAEAWRTGSYDARAEVPACEIVSSRLKRGTSLLTRMLVETASQAVEQGGIDAANVAAVFGSAYGEMQIAVDQMNMMKKDDGLVSPTRFKNSVHNTAAGIFSIAARNEGFATAIAAGGDTVAMSLLEAVNLLASHRYATAVVAVGEEALPPPLDSIVRLQPLSVAFALTTEPPPASAVPRVGFPRREQRSRGSAPHGAFAHHPSAPALDLLDAAAAGKPATVALSIDDDAGAWHVDLVR